MFVYRCDICKKEIQEYTPRFIEECIHELLDLEIEHVCTECESATITDLTTTINRLTVTPTTTQADASQIADGQPSSNEWVYGVEIIKSTCAMKSPHMRADLYRHLIQLGFEGKYNADCIVEILTKTYGGYDPETKTYKGYSPSTIRTYISEIKNDKIQESETIIETIPPKKEKQAKGVQRITHNQDLWDFYPNLRDELPLHPSVIVAYVDSDDYHHVKWAVSPKLAAVAGIVYDPEVKLKGQAQQASVNSPIGITTEQALKVLRRLKEQSQQEQTTSY